LVIGGGAAIWSMTLVAGADNEGASARARELGHDLDGRHWMVLTQYRDQPVDGAPGHAVERAAGSR
jgi:hypothetical protein